MTSILYKRGKRGQVEQWSVRVESHTTDEDSPVDLIAESGQVGGVLTEYRRTILVGKNLGKRNETTPLEQAVSEAESLYQEKLDKGYTEHPSGVALMSYVRPMLALSYMERRSRVLWPNAAQPKLNGIRCVVIRNEDSLIFTSRNGKPFTGLQHLHEDLLKLMPANCVLDAELYKHGVPLQRISSLVRSSKKIDYDAIRENIQLHVFDVIVDNVTFTNRYDMLRKMFSGKDLDFVHRVNTYKVETESDCEALMDKFLQEGYEGLMLRSPNSLYLRDYRSEHLLKYKKFKDEEFRIVDAVEGKGVDKGCCIFVCATTDGKEFNVRCAATREERIEQFANKEKYIGKLLTVQFQEYTIYGIPEFPVGIAVRDYE